MGFGKTNNHKDTKDTKKIQMKKKNIQQLTPNFELFADRPRLIRNLELVTWNQEPSIPTLQHSKKTESRAIRPASCFEKLF